MCCDSTDIHQLGTRGTAGEFSGQVLPCMYEPVILYRLLNVLKVLILRKRRRIMQRQVLSVAALLVKS